MSTVAVGAVEAKPGFRNGAFQSSSYEGYSAFTPSCFEEASACFSNNDRLIYGIGRKVSGPIRQCFNPYQGTLRFIYEPYDDDSYDSIRTIYYIEGVDRNSYFKVYVLNGVFYAEMKGIASSGTSTTRQATASWPVGYTLGDKIHVVVQWDLFARTTGENYLEIYVNSSAGAQCSDAINVLYWGDSSKKTFAIGNSYNGSECCEGMLCGIILDDRLWESSKIESDYNSGNFTRMAYAVTYDTIFSFPFERNSNDNDYNAFGVDRSFAHEVGAQYSSAGLFPLQNPNGNLVRDGYMFENGLSNWTENGVKAGKSDDPRYSKYGRNS